MDPTQAHEAAIRTATEAIFGMRDADRWRHEALILEQAIGDGVNAALEMVWQADSCDCDDCTHRPAWITALDQLRGELTDSIGEAVVRLIRDRTRERLEAFAKAHPEAAWRPVSVSDEGSAA